MLVGLPILLPWGGSADYKSAETFFRWLVKMMYKSKLLIYSKARFVKVCRNYIPIHIFTIICLIHIYLQRCFFDTTYRKSVCPTMATNWIYPRNVRIQTRTLWQISTDWGWWPYPWTGTNITDLPINTVSITWCRIKCFITCIAINIITTAKNSGGTHKSRIITIYIIFLILDWTII